MRCRATRFCRILPPSLPAAVACCLRCGKASCPPLPCRNQSSAMPGWHTACGNAAASSAASRMKSAMQAGLRPRACKMRQGRERPCLKTPLRFESWLAPVLQRSATGAAGRCSVSGQASSALCMPAQAPACMQDAARA